MLNIVNIFFFTTIAGIASALNKDYSATKLWLKASRLDPTNPIYKTTAGQHLWKISKKLYAEKLFRSVLVSNPDYIPAIFNLAYALQKKNAHSEVVTLMSKVIIESPSHDLAYYGRGLSHKALENDSEATSDFKSAIRLQPMAPHAYYQLSIILSKQKNMNELHETINKLSAFEPQVANQLKKELNIY